MHKEPINLLKLNVIVADGVCLSLHTQYCNGGDLADYLQGKHLSAPHTYYCSSKQSS